MTESLETNQPNPLTCTMCRNSSTWRAAFTEVKDGTIKRLCCPACTYKLHSKWGWIVALLSPVGLALAIYLHRRDPHNLLRVGLIAFWTFSLSQYLLVLLHEMGHAAAANLLGAPAYAIEMGSAPWILDRTIGSIRWRLGHRVLGGLTYHAPCEGPKSRRDAILIIAAGPFANLLIAVVALGAGFAMPGRLADSSGKIVLLTIGATSLLQLAYNAWPRRIATSVGSVANDMLRIIELWRGDLEDVRAGRMARHWSIALYAFADSDYALAERAALLAREQCDDPQNATAIAVMRGGALCGAGRIDEALAELHGVQERPIEDFGVRALADNNLAWAYFIVDEPTSQERGLALAARAHAIAPWDATYLNTYVCLLATSASPGNGRADQARAFLVDVETLNVRGRNRGFAALARGLLACADGNFDTARREYENAKSRGATAAPLRVLERRLAST